MTRDFAFRFDRSHRLPALPLGIRPQTSGVRVTDTELLVRFGFWRLRTPLANVTEVRMTGPYSWWRTVGPPRLSLKDRGITFATNGHRGLCISFARPVAVLDPTGSLRHPAATVTVAELDALAAALGHDVLT